MWFIKKEETTKEHAFNTITQGFSIGGPFDIKNLKALCNLCLNHHPCDLYKDYAGRTYCEGCYNRWVSKIKSTHEQKADGTYYFNHEWI